MHIEQHVFLNNSGVLCDIDNYKIEAPPQSINFDPSSPLSLPQTLKPDLCAHESTMYTHACVQYIDDDCNMIYKNTITTDCFDEPICKEIKVNFKLIKLNLSIDQIINFIKFLEMNKIFNDIGVYRLFYHLKKII